MVFWMGKQEFYVYGGGVQRLPCTVRDYIFTDFNILQSEKVTAGTNTSFSEVWWFYPSANSQENDKYVIYNYQQKIWYYGNLARTVWLDRGIESNPVAAGTDHYLYQHESGLDDGSTSEAATSSVVEQFTNQVNLRLRGRSFAVKVASSDTGVTWRLGSPRLDVKPDGRR